MENFTKVVRPGTAVVDNITTCSVYCKIEYKDSKLSITGVEGPLRNGDANGGCGQIVDSIPSLSPVEPWTRAMLKQFAEVWDKWHLNDMRAGCQHQRANWNAKEEVEVVSYKLTLEANHTRQAALVKATEAGLKGQPLVLTETERALAEMEDWFQSRFVVPDADSPLSGCYEVEKREKKFVGWVYEHEHPKGILCKPCEVCGYKYGTSWLKEEVPEDVLEWLKALPDTDRQPAWV